jgi:hypothetical protein
VSDDRRPRPKYGELAPEGWTWTPPVQETTDHEPATTPADPVLDHPEPDPAGSSTPAPTLTAAQARPLRLGDVVLTITLILFGVVVTATGLPQLFALRQTINLFYDQQQLGSYGGGNAADIAGATAAILHVVILLTVIGVSVRLIGKRRIAFYVPVIGGALALLAVMVCMVVALMADPNLLASYSSTAP